MERYLYGNAQVAQALKVLKITPAEYSRLLANRSSRISS
jgi:hypothetical protein